MKDGVIVTKDQDIAVYTTMIPFAHPMGPGFDGWE